MCTQTHPPWHCGPDPSVCLPPPTPPRAALKRRGPIPLRLRSTKQSQGPQLARWLSRLWRARRTSTRGSTLVSACFGSAPATPGRGRPYPVGWHGYSGYRGHPLTGTAASRPGTPACPVEQTDAQCKPSASMQALQQTCPREGSGASQTLGWVGAQAAKQTPPAHPSDFTESATTQRGS